MFPKRVKGRLFDYLSVWGGSPGVQWGGCRESEGRGVERKREEKRNRDIDNGPKVIAREGRIVMRILVRKKQANFYGH